MKRNTVLFMLTACMILVMSPGVHAQDLDYKIGPGDVLHISVWKNADLTRQVVVLPDGRIHFPLVKELNAAGQSVKTLEKELPFLAFPW